MLSKYSWDKIAQLKVMCNVIRDAPTLCNIVRGAPDNIPQENNQCDVVWTTSGHFSATFILDQLTFRQ